MTRADHLSGTDRVAEVASAEEAAVVVNIQGDEPLIDPRHRRRHSARGSRFRRGDGDAEEKDRGPARNRRSQRGQGGG